MPSKPCRTCGRPRHSGLCNMARLSDGRVVHVDRIDSFTGDIRKEIEAGEVRVVDRFIRKEPLKKTTVRRS